MNRQFVVATLAALIFAHSGSLMPSAAQSLAPVPSTIIPGVTVAGFPRIDGSTATQPITDLLVCRSLGLTGELRQLPQRGDYAESSLSITFRMGTPPEKITLYNRTRRYHNKTHEAYVNFINGSSDLLLISRLPSADELKDAKARGVSFDVKPFALDALIFLVHKTNPVNSLSLEQLQAVYTGKSTLWRNLGGRDFPVKLYTRNRNSGSEELVRDLLLKGTTPKAGGNAVTIGEMSGLINHIAMNVHSIGPSLYYFHRNMFPVANTKTLQVSGVPPVAANIASRKYPLVAPIYAVVRRDEKAGSSALRVRDWLLSPAGQRLVADTGYIPVRPADVK